jgi:hypothetical protein
MHIIGKLPLDHPNIDYIKECLESEGYEICQGKSLLTFPLFEDSQDVFLKPDFFPQEGVYQIVVAEEGGLEVSFSEVVCNIFGGKLKPFKKEMGNPNGSSAYFSLGNPFRTVQYSNELTKEFGFIEDYSIFEHEIVHNQDTVEIKSTEIWRGASRESLPKDLSKFSKALEAAEAKANCENCTHTHYAADYDPPQVSGKRVVSKVFDAPEQKTYSPKNPLFSEIAKEIIYNYEADPRPFSQFEREMSVACRRDVNMIADILEKKLYFFIGEKNYELSRK